MDLAALEEEIKQQIQSAIDRAEQQMKELGDPLDMFDHLYAELPPSLADNREPNWSANWSGATGRNDHG